MLSLLLALHICSPSIATARHAAALTTAARPLPGITDVTTHRPLICSWATARLLLVIADTEFGACRLIVTYLTGVSNNYSCCIGCPIFDRHVCFSLPSDRRDCCCSPCIFPSEIPSTELLPRTYPGTSKSPLASTPEPLCPPIAGKQHRSVYLQSSPTIRLGFFPPSR